MRPRLAAALALPLLLPACMTMRDLERRGGLRPFGGTRAYFADGARLFPDDVDTTIAFTASMVLLPFAGPALLGGLWLVAQVADRAASATLDLVLLPAALVAASGGPGPRATVSVVGAGSSIAEARSLSVGGPTSASTAAGRSSIAPATSWVPPWDPPPPAVRPAGSAPEAPRGRGVRPAR